MLETIEHVKRLVDSEVEEYDSFDGHGILNNEERVAWLAELQDRIDSADGAKWLEVGAGTGVFTHLLMELIGPNNSVVAVDISKDSLDKNKCSLPIEYRDRVTYLVGDVHEENLFADTDSGEFDYIVCRQVVVLFHDPIKVFKNWTKLLKPGGKVFIIDGLWSPDVWTGEWAELVDVLPLSCPQSLTEIANLLLQAGLQVEQTELLTQVNQYFENSGKDDCPRFVIVAKNNNA